MIVCVCRGGLANRLKPLAACFALAKRTGRELAINWSLDSHCQASFQDLYQNSIHSIGFEQVMESPSIKLYADRKAVETWSFTELSRIIAEYDFAPLSQTNEMLTDTQEMIVVYANDYLPEASATELKAFFDTLQPVNAIRVKIEQTCSALGINRSLTGVHARGSDFGAPVELYLQRMRDERQKKTNLRFFVSSDTREYEQRILREFPDTIVYEKAAYVERNDSGQDWSTANILRSAASVAEAIVDMHLLAATDFKIYSPYSSFAHVVNMMSNGNIQTFPAPSATNSIGLISRILRSFVRRTRKLLKSGRATIPS